MLIGVTEDEWMHDAIKDDKMVAYILLSFVKDARPLIYEEVIPACWGRRLPRSRPATGRFGLPMTEGRKRKEGECSTRCSPTTPLSWSGGGSTASPSTPDTGYEDTTSLYPYSNRSKVPLESTSAVTKHSKKIKARRSPENEMINPNAEHHRGIECGKAVYSFDLNLTPPEEDVIQEGLMDFRR